MNELTLIEMLLHDVQRLHGAVFSITALNRTIKKVRSRVSTEGLGFLTKTLPRLDKALTKALSAYSLMNATALRFTPQVGSQLPKFLGELFNQVLAPDGSPLQSPCVLCIKSLRQVLTCFYKYELPYEDKQNGEVLQQFERTEAELSTVSIHLRLLRDGYLRWLDNRRGYRAYRSVRQRSSLEIPDTGRLHDLVDSDLYHETTLDPLDGSSRSGILPDPGDYPLVHAHSPEGESARFSWRSYKGSLPPENRESGDSEGCGVCVDHVTARTAGDVAALSTQPNRELSGNGVNPDERRYCVVYRARRALKTLFADFDERNIFPRHGPGAVATKQQLWAKYLWKNVSSRITDVYPLDEYFYSSLGHVCDAHESFDSIGDASLPARVILVPKDSRGPRLISCEPVDYQWVQQGLGRAIVRHVEAHWLTRHNVHFTSQRTNQFGALLGSSTGRYATLDLKEASDRVSIELVRLLFPSRIVRALEACRSLSTEMPCGKLVTLKKYAPMGSCLCFPVMALTIWVLLHARFLDTDTRESITVFGDDVIVPTAKAANAIELLESFGLKINRDKSCTGGFFRESCGTDAFKGVDVTPVRFRTVWSSRPRADVYCSWIEYSNNLYDKQLYASSNYITASLRAIYGAIPDESLIGKRVPSLRVSPDTLRNFKSRVSRRFQRRLYLYRTVTSPPIFKKMPGWSMLLRYFTEGVEPDYMDLWWDKERQPSYEEKRPFRVSTYTRRQTSMLVWRWR